MMYVEERKPSMSQRKARKGPTDRYNYLSNFRQTSLHLENREYDGPGAYHVITCAQGVHGRAPLFEHPILRKLLQTHWLDLPLRFPSAHLDEFTIMPDHLHFLIWPAHWPDLAQKRPPYLWEIMRAYKSSVAVDWIAYVEKHHPTWSAKIWQDGYYERIVRLGALDRIRRYIRNNPDQLPDALYKQMKWVKPDTARQSQ
jgi:REP element-mobilizing transposase RayT